MVGHIRVGDRAQVISGAGISKDVMDGVKMQGVPAMDEESYGKYSQFIAKFPEFITRLQELEKKLGSASDE